MRKILIGIAVVLLLLVGAAVALPFIFKDKIVEQVKKTTNESLTATVDFEDVDLSLFRHFPKVSVGLVGLTVTGTGPFEDVRLLQCPQVDVAVDLWSVIFGDKIKIKAVYAEKPDLRIYVLQNGLANYDIVKPGAEEQSQTDPSSGVIELEHYEINDGRILYDDRGLDFRAELGGVDHQGSGEFTADVYDFVMQTAAEQLSVGYGGVQYLANAKTDWDATLSMDMKNSKYTFKENKLRVNELDLDLDGSIALPNDDDTVLDLTFGTPANTFKSLLSLVPGAYVENFRDVQANGTVQFGGFVKGTYNETTYPAFKIDFKVANGDFKYPSLPLGVTGINIDASINSPTKRLNDMSVDIPKFALRIGSNPLDGYFHLRTPETNPTVDTKINGTLNLGELSQAFPFEGVQKLTGILRANITAKASMAQIDRKAYDQVQMNGDFSAQGIEVRADGQPPVIINAVNTSLSPQRVEIRTFDAKLGKSDIKATGSIDNILAYFSPNKTMVGNLSFTSAYFDANEWMGAEEADPAAGKVPSETATATEKAFDAWDFTVDGSVRRLIYDTYNLTNVAMKGHFRPNKMDVDNFALQIGKSDLRGSGSIVNAWNYLFDDQTLSGTLDLQSNYLDLNQFMTDEPAATKTAAATPPPAEEVLLVPKNIAMQINARMNEVVYTTYTLTDLNGAIVVRDGVASLKDCTAGVIGGRVALNGDYDTRNPAKPGFNMDLAMQEIGFRQAFQTFATVKAFAPIAQLIDGKFNTTLSLSGILGKDMTPNFETLQAAGFIETLGAVISNFKGFQEIGSKLNIAYLQRFELGNTRNWFEIKDGQVVVKPFDVQVRDVAMKISGSTGLAKPMDFQILTKVPRKALGPAQGAVNAGLGWVGSQASRFGVNIAQGEFINMRFDLTGSMANPAVAVKILGTDGERTIQDEAKETLQATAEKAKDSLRTLANQQVERAKDQANAARQRAEDSLRTLANKKLEEAKKEAEKKVGTEVTKKAEEALGTEGQKKVDDVKKKIEGWDPFKKKPKSGG